MSYIEVKHIKKSYQKGINVLEDISFEVEEGHVMSIIGNSGGGKSTLLRMIAGYEQPDAGEIFKNNEALCNDSFQMPASRRKIGMVFQDFALFPHLTVDRNIRYGFNAKGNYSLTELYDLTKLKGFENRYPHELSGGEQQRVAIARSLAASSDVLLMDEPFSNIDIANKEKVRVYLKELLNQAGITSIIVTHDYRDAMILANDVLVLNEGRTAQYGNIHEVYRFPNSLIVAKLFGTCNMIKGSLVDGKFITTFGEFSSKDCVIRENHLLIRPESLQLDLQQDYKGKIVSIEALGIKFRYTLQSENEIIQVDDYSKNFKVGDEVGFKMIIN